ncbi:IMP dehydrogenase [Candidatus Riesia pediculischaeffi]|uniref:Inosine-5'-monophosphate dehydrogenase n=1 Tax=Candidatus Riesia pediculischaeffi PTSU TaxID=1401651 RepID=A0A0C1VJF1_9ENTR|nr:IMP dehydrogenase [Candidatus Riesia pediculischaeffi]KIE63975.1 Inosine-5'-monophosphate dehydrogenase [Candidatus Riesia pediculischaeffi PTSU]
MLRIKKIKGLTFDDVLLVPAYSTIVSDSIDLSTHLTKEIQLNIPIISASMDTLAESELSIELAQSGGIGFIHKNMTIQNQSEEVKKVKNYQVETTDNWCFQSNSTILQIFKTAESKHTMQYRIEEKKFVSFSIVRNIDFPKNINHPSCKIFSKYKISIVEEQEKYVDVFHKMISDHSKYALIINNCKDIMGMFSIEVSSKDEKNFRACKDKRGRLRVGAAISANENDDRIKELIESEVDVILIDSSHGHSDIVLRKIFETKKKYPNLPIIGGNVATSKGALDLVQAGADAVKVGIGPGSICTTRIVTGVGIPQITAISESSEALSKTEIPIIADGGIRFSGDVGKAIAAGAKCVMLGSVLAGTKESIGKLVIYKDGFYRQYRGMGSKKSMVHGSYDRYFQLNIKETGQFVPEGVERKILYKGFLKDVVHKIIGGLRSCMRLTGCNNINQLRLNTEFITISQSGIKENHAHGTDMLGDSLSYRNQLEIFKLK